jgi:hypothetical protein
MGITRARSRSNDARPGTRLPVICRLTIFSRFTWPSIPDTGLPGNECQGISLLSEYLHLMVDRFAPSTTF